MTRVDKTIHLSLIVSIIFGMNGCGSSGHSGGEPTPLPSSTAPVVTPTPAPEPTPEKGEDPLFSAQWYLENTGQSSGAEEGGTPGEDMDITALWKSYRGSKSVVVGVVDESMEASHPDLKTNFDLELSHNYIDDSHDPSPTSKYSSPHGTCVSGIIAAKGWNSIGVSGVVPDGKIAGFNAISRATEANLIDALSRGKIAVSSNSWGGTGGLTKFESLVAAVEEGSLNGREGKGRVYVFAAGNARKNANFSYLTNNRYAVCVSAVNADGNFSSYSNFGSSIWVAGMGGEYADEKPAIVTTDLTGLDKGWDTENHHFDAAGNENGDYTNIMNGTSAACPMVSGVIALMMEANPQLSWRDLRYILAVTARKNDVGNDQWSMNGAGHWVNYNYGFGVVDAYKAVMKAKDFTGLKTEENVEYSDTTEYSIPENGSKRTVSAYVTQKISIEYVVVTVTIEGDSSNIGNLEIVLTSPEGTESILAWGKTSLWDEYDHWHFGTARHLDESSQGSWKLSIRDTDVGNKYKLKEWKLKIYGHEGE